MPHALRTRCATASRLVQFFLCAVMLVWMSSCSDDATQGALTRTCEPNQNDMVVNVGGFGFRFFLPDRPWPKVLTQSSAVVAQWQAKIGESVTIGNPTPLNWTESPYETPELSVQLREHACGELTFRLTTFEPEGVVSAVTEVCGEAGLTVTAWWVLGPSGANPTSGGWEARQPDSWVEGQRLCVGEECLSPYIILDRRSLLGADEVGPQACAFAFELRVFPPEDTNAGIVREHLAGTCGSSSDELLRFEIPGGGEAPAEHTGEFAVIVQDPWLTPPIFARLVQFMEAHGAPPSLVSVRGRRLCY